MTLDAICHECGDALRDDQDWLCDGCVIAGGEETTACAWPGCVYDAEAGSEWCRDHHELRADFAEQSRAEERREARLLGEGR